MTPHDSRSTMPEIHDSHTFCNGIKLGETAHRAQAYHYDSPQLFVLEIHRGGSLLPGITELTKLFRGSALQNVRGGLMHRVLVVFNLVESEREGSPESLVSLQIIIGPIKRK
jgi:hypothetical protein